MKQRILSGLILLPLPVFALYFGTPYFETLMAVCVAVMGWEWERMVEGRFSPAGLVMAVTGVVSIYLLDFFSLSVLFLPVAVALGLFFYAKQKALAHPRLFAVGVAYATIPLTALVYLRADYGFMAALWTMGVVWAMDTGAYAFGKLIGGPKMAPKISPKKTWAGLIGGMATAALWGALCACLTRWPHYTVITLVSAAYGALSQMGDLLESAVKRYLNVKDSSQLIPGHGGIFDRMDAVLLLAPVSLAGMMLFPALCFWG